jgi:hypothetical protein
MKEKIKGNRKPSLLHTNKILHAKLTNGQIIEAIYHFPDGWWDRTNKEEIDQGQIEEYWEI